VPHARPSLDSGEVHGIDVSNHQGDIDWHAVSADGIGAAMIKATEGNDYEDPRFQENWTESAQAGVRRGAYHFFTLCSPGAEQAENFLAAAPPDDDALPPAIDLELIGACDERPPQSVVSDELEDFRHTVEGAWGRPLLVYARGDFRSEYDLGALVGNPQWVTHFFIRPRDDAWAVWQIHYVARIDGIDGGVDLDVSRLDD
jgi:lysozyme